MVFLALSFLFGIILSPDREQAEDLDKRFTIGGSSSELLK